ncbi:hypothetical protein [Apilactobacillus xinyiensis]|uniref:hypothetical protein n=1 Tax=Apilactobacillus xinyiensis TaxID=2841032 RepID=UPI00200CA993|nr:hypothetical protein [Apilactobacillus xinyiensis]MCL0319378.1 hypothetical protein [Apilactobacillus xinyiensis]
MDKQFILDKVKLLIPNTYANDSYDEILDYVIDKVIQDIANYTHISKDELPEELNHTAVGMSVTLIKTDELLVPVNEQANNGVASITEGNESISFKSTADEYLKIQSANAVTKDYKKTLNQFRVVDFGL